MAMVEINGEYKSRQQWCDILGIKTSTITRRMQRMGLTEKEALLYIKPTTQEELKKEEFESREIYKGPMLLIGGTEHYYATEDGRVWNSKLRKFLKPKVTKSNQSGLYSKRVNLFGETRYLHTVICETWHGKQEGMWVQACDGDITNTHKDNLYWATPKDIISTKRKPRTSHKVLQDTVTP